MARRDALLRLHKSLIARRNDLHRKLAGELANLREFRAADPMSDPADVAFESGSDEMATQLAELDARELQQIERALRGLKQGTYGLCEGCQCKIPVSRLNALPYTTFCIECQREREKYPDWDERRAGNDWEKVVDAEARIADQRDVNLSDLEMDLSSNR